MFELTLNHVSDRFKSTMRMPRRTLRLASSPLVFAHLIEHDKWVEVLLRDSGEPASHREAFTLESRRSGRDINNRSNFASVGGTKNSIQSKNVLDRNCGHNFLQQQNFQNVPN
jgi:hypothetical protein